MHQINVIVYWNQNIQHMLWHCKSSSRGHLSDDLVKMSNSLYRYPPVMPLKYVTIQGHNVQTFLPVGVTKKICVSTHHFITRMKIFVRSLYGVKISVKMIWLKLVWWSFVVVIIFCLKNKRRRNKLTFFLIFIPQ